MSTTECLFISFCEMTLLHVAAEEGHLDIVEYLVGKGANKNIKNLFKVSTYKRLYYTYPLIEDTSVLNGCLGT